MALAAEAPDRLHAHGLGEPPPVHRGVAERLRGVQQRAVLDEEQRVDEQRRHRLEALVRALGIARRVERLPLAVLHLEARARLLAIRREDAERGEPPEPCGEARLLLDVVAAGLEPVDEGGQAGVAEALVVRAGAREAHARARARLHVEREMTGQHGEHQGLHGGGAHLDEPGEERDDREDRNERGPPLEQLAHPCQQGNGPGGAGQDLARHDPGGEGRLATR